MLIYVIELFVVVMLLVFIWTQLIMPIMQNRALFPMFRKSHKLNNELIEVEQSAFEQSLAAEVKSKKSQLKKGTK